MEGSPAKNVMQRAVIEQHERGVVTTIFIPVFNAENFPSHPEILYRQDFRELLKLIRANQKEKPSSIPDKAVESDSSVHPQIDGNRTESLDGPRRGFSRGNIIDILEKKYCGSGHGIMNFEENDSERNDDDDQYQDEEHDDKDAGTEVPRKKRKSERQGDYYDMDDGFIDDSENIMQIESQIEGNRLKTKHSGFFINAGDLEVTKIDKKGFHSVKQKSGKSLKRQNSGKKKDSDPSMAATAYQLFCKAKRTAVREANSDQCSSNGEINKIIGSMWKNMNDEEKQPWLAAATAANKRDKVIDSSSSSKLKSKERRSKKIADKRDNTEKLSKEDKKSTSEKMPPEKGFGLTAYGMFCKAKKKIVKDTFPGECNEIGGVAKKVGLLWKELDKNEKSIWTKAAASANAIIGPVAAAVSPFDLFWKAMKKEVRKSNPEACSVKGEIKKIISKKWESLDITERNKWIHSAKLINERVTDRPVDDKPLSAHQLFFHSKSPSSDSTNVEETDQAWLSISDKERQIWEEAAGLASSSRDEANKANLKIKQTGENVSIGVKKRKADVTFTSAHDWSDPPKEVATALQSLRDVVARDLAEQEEAAKSKPQKKAKSDGEEAAVPSAPCLKKITEGVAQSLHAVDRVALQHDMPGTMPIATIKRAKQSKPDGEAASTEEKSCETAIESNEPLSYLSILRNVINSSHISSYHIRTSILKHRSQVELNELSAKIDSDIIRIAEKIRGEIIENKKYQKDSAVGSAESLATVEPTPVDEKPPAVELPFTCKWSRQLREDLYELSENVSKWVSTENHHRKKHLSAKDKKQLNSAEIEDLSVQMQTGVVLGKISDVAFAQPYDCTVCEKSGIAYMRTVISLERRRIKNKISQ